MADKTPPRHLVTMTDAFQKMLNTLAKGVSADDLKEDTQTVWEDRSTIALPNDPVEMSRIKAIEVLTAQEAAATQEYELFERIPGMPYDAAAAFVHVLKERYGWAHAQTKQTWFGKEPPRMQVVKVGHLPEDYIEVPVGEFKLDDISVAIETQFVRPAPDSKSKFMDFAISGTVSFEDRKVIMNLISATKAHLAKNSIYRGKPLRLRVDGDGDLAALVQPEFLDLDAVDTNGLILNDDIQALVNMTLNTPIKKTDLCRKHRIPLKRGILLEGPYGTGKSLTALVTAKHAVTHGWTYVTVDNATALAQTLEFARMFQPCVVFAEDIDRVIDQNRSEEANDIINTIDGIVSKRDEVITVLTTNHIENIPAVMLRPGRLDAIVRIAEPDRKAALRLVGYYAGNLLPGDQPLTGIGEKLEGLLPSTIREVVERAKLGMLMHDRTHLEATDLIASATGIRAHADLLKAKKPESTPEHQLGVAFKGLFVNDPNGVAVLAALEEKVDKIQRSLS